MSDHTRLTLHTRLRIRYGTPADADACQRLTRTYSLMSLEGEIAYNEGRKVVPAMLETSGDVSQRLRRTSAMANHTTKQCPVCGKEFRVKPSDSKRRVNCSMVCYATSRTPNRFDRLAEYQPGSDTYIIPLTKGYFATVDPCDLDLADFVWCATIGSSGVIYALRTVTIANNTTATYYLHRVILSRVLGRELEQSELVDHRDRDGRNCSRSNLRLANSSQNTSNTAGHRDSTTGIKGIHWSKARKKWVAQIKVNGRRIHLGMHATSQLAHAAYMEAAREHFGEFAFGGEEATNE